MPVSKKNSSRIHGNDKGHSSFPIVAIGASAGGLEALEALFDNMPRETGTAFVIIQHSAPGGKSMLGDILKKHTRLAVHDIEDGASPKPDCVYINPPGKDVTLFHSIFHLSEPAPVHGMRLPIDNFLRSLARELGQKAVCIILSGTGSDGTLGLKAIKEEAGMAIAQEIDQAKYGGMPASAIATGLVDFVLPVEKMPEVLMNYTKHPFLKEPKKIEIKESQFTGYIQKIISLIGSETGNDFSCYKPKTLRRRVERRMALHKIETISTYHRFLEENPAEIKRLFQELLIGVTQFFRDPAAFNALREKVVPNILKQKTDGTPVRIWVPGCSTGEEPLSLAMLFTEEMEKNDKHTGIQIFATDIDPDAIERARKAEYPEAIVSDVSKERLKRFFTRKESTYKVNSEIREMVVYAPQNMVSDPPFSRLDLISCRNVLIYMDATLQKKLIPLFHFTLNPHGYLFLGSSETIGGFTHLFSPLDSKWKIFRVKKDSTRVKPAEFSLKEVLASTDFNRMKEKMGKDRVEEAVDRLIVSHYAPATVLIDKRYDALFLRGPVERYLELPKGPVSMNLLKIARPGIPVKLPAALKKAEEEKVPVTLPRVPVKQNGEMKTVDVTIRPLGEKDETSGLMVVVFEESPPPQRDRRKKRKPRQEEESHPRVVELESELQATRENLQSTIEELEAANEELTSSNEELQSTNEEMQSTNEELATAREELQSTNEELITVNSELENKVEELPWANDDISNLFASTEIGTIFLDRQLHIKRFTPAVKRVFNLLPADVGRSIGDITSKFTPGNILEDANEVLETLQMREKEIMAEGKWFSMRFLPYRTTKDQIGGVVISFIDISEIKRIEREVITARNYAQNIVNTVREPLLILDSELRVISANRSFYRFFSVTPESTVGRLVYNVGNSQWNIPELRRLLEEILPANTSFDDYVVEHEFPVIGLKKMLLNARRIEQDEETPNYILLAMEDITRG